MNSKILTYANQLEFKAYAKSQGIDQNAFYFDCVTGVNALTNKDIPGLTADSTLTFGQALQILKTTI